MGIGSVKIFSFTTWDSVAENPDDFDISTIVEGVFSPNEKIFSKACTAIRKRNNKKDVAPFIRRLVKHQDADVRRVTVEILPDVSLSMASKYCPLIALTDKNIDVCKIAFNITLEMLCADASNGSKSHVKTKPNVVFSLLFWKKTVTKSIYSFLSKAIASKRKEIRLIAAENLYKICESKDLDCYFILVNKLSTDYAEHIRQEVIKKVSQVYDDRSIEILCNALQDKSAAVRISALQGLSSEIWKDNPATLDAIIAASKDQDIKVRYMAAIALAKTQFDPVNDEQAIMFRIIKDQWEGLDDYGEKTAEIICACPKISKDAEATLIRIGPIAVKSLIVLLEEPDWVTRRNAACIISKIANHNYMDTLQRKANEENNREVKFWLEKSIQGRE